MPHLAVEAASRFNEKRKKRNEMTYFLSLGIGTDSNFDFLHEVTNKAND